MPGGGSEQQRRQQRQQQQQEEAAVPAGTVPTGGGVADYFAVLGVGDRLVLKAAQKDRTSSSSPPPSPDAGGREDGGTSAAAAAAAGGEEEEGTARMAQFRREIVEVGLVATSAGQEEGEEEKEKEEEGGRRRRGGEHSGGISGTSDLPFAPSAAADGSGAADADAVTAVPSDASSSAWTADGPAPTPRGTGAAAGGPYEAVVRSVLPERAAARAGRGAAGADLCPMHGMRAAVLGRERGPAASYSSSSRTAAAASSPAFSPTASPGRKILGGLGRRVGDRVRAQLPQLHPILGAAAGAAGMAGAAAAAGAGAGYAPPSTSWNPAGTSPPPPSPRRRRRRYHLAYRRRGPDEADRPAVADVAVRYARVHRATVLGGRGNEEEEAAAAGVAAAGVASVDGRDGGRSPLPNPRRQHFFPDSERKPPRPRTPAADPDPGAGEAEIWLSDVLELPRGYDEWSVPEGYRRLGGPPPPPPPDDDQFSPQARARMRRTVLMYGSPTSSLVGGSSPSPSEAGGGGGGGIEAYYRPSSLPGSRAGSPSPSAASSSQGGGPSSRAASPTPPAGYAAHFAPVLLSPDELPLPGEEDAAYDYVPVLALRRQRVGPEERYREDPALVDVAVTFYDSAGAPVTFGHFEDCGDDDEDDDEAGIVAALLRKTKWAASADAAVALEKASRVARAQEHHGQGQKMPLSIAGAPVCLVRRNSPQGFADAPFATSVLDRFPSKDYKGLPLPAEELPMFCYPTGCRLYRAKFQDSPLAQCYGFVVKNERGDNIHVSCVSFMEPLTEAKIKQLDEMSLKRCSTSIPHRRYFQQQRGQVGSSLSHAHSTGSKTLDAEQLSSKLLLTGFDDMTTFENKTVCLISRYPFWTAFRRFLSHLHIMSGSSSDLPLERCISHLLLSVPVPKPGGQAIVVPLPTLNCPMILSAPPAKDLPLLDLPYQRLFACLEVPSVVTIVLGFLSLERKVIIMSVHPSLVTDACELLRSLLFPFELCAPYVPRLTQPFMSCLEFPGAIFVGIHDDETEDGLAASVRRNLPEDSVIIDLDTGNIDSTGDTYEVLKQCWNIIPSEPRTILVQEIETLCRDAGLVPGQEPIDSQFDSAFDTSVSAGAALVEDLDDPGHQAKEPLDDRAIRDCFLRFYCSIFGGYERYLVVPDIDFVISGNEWFDTKGFLSSVSKDHAPYLGSLVSTQLFQSFIQRRTEASDVRCVLFDDCLSEYHSSKVPYGRLGGDVETSSAVGGEVPQLMFSLLVDQCATEVYNEPDVSSIKSGTVSFDVSDNEPETSTSFPHPNASYSVVDASIFSATGDYITAPSHQGLMANARFLYCVDGNPSFPNMFQKKLFFPAEPSDLSAVSAEVVVAVITRSDRELDEANRRKHLAVSQRSLSKQRRCLWQLPKLMGSHVLGAWLMCIPSLISQPGLADELQARYLLRALGAMRNLRSRQRIIPDEAAYRCLMIACGRARSDRRVELVKLFGLLRSDGLFPSAVTLGQYTRAVAEGYSKRSSGVISDEEIVNSTWIAASAPEALADLDAAIALSLLDGNLPDLEDSGRRWRHRQTRESKEDSTNDRDPYTASADNQVLAPNPSSARKQAPKKNLHKMWMPITTSSSFVLPVSGQKVHTLTENDFEFVSLWSRATTCKSCSYVPLDEEIMNGWDIICDEKDECSCDITCPRCGSQITPLLGYSCMTITEALVGSSEKHGVDSEAAGESSDLPSQICPSLGYSGADDEASSYVKYLSPSRMRLLMEEYVDKNGEEVLERDSLRKLDPCLFYNLWWFCSRFSLPLPLMASGVNETDKQPTHLLAICAWDRQVADKGCESAAKAVLAFLGPVQTEGEAENNDFSTLLLSADIPLLYKFNLHSFAQGDWDHPELSKILIKLVEACDKKDFVPVLECALACSIARRERLGLKENDGSATGSELLGSDAILHTATDIDCYRTLLYLCRYQCTSAFHTFFPATAKACKGYHFWCAQGTPFPMYDRYFRDAVNRVRNSGRELPTMHDISEVALGFRCVFGHVM